MNSTTSTNPNAKPDDRKVAMPIRADAKPEAGAKHDACGTTTDKSAAPANTHDGKLVSIKGDKMVMSSHEGKDHSHTVAADAKVCCDGTACKPEDLKVGSKIRVTTKKDEKHVATKIESLDKHAEFAKSV
jgi:hypothetical protein